MVAYLGILIWFGSLIPAVLLKKTNFDESQKEPLTFRKMFANVKNPDLIFKLSLPSAIVGLGAGFTLPLMNVYFKEGLGTSDVEIGAIFAAGQALLVIASFLAPLIALRLGKVRAIVAMQLISVPFILMLAYATEIGGVIGSVAMVTVLAYVARITTMDVTGPIREAFGMEILDPAERGTQVGIQRAATAALYGGAGFIGGQFMSSGNFTTPFLLMAGCYLFSIMLFWTFFNGWKAKPAYEIAGQGAD
jgi:Na+/melibiose symporter-like transporter